VVSNIGADKKIGATNAFLISFIFSPLIGFLAVIASPTVERKFKKIPTEARNLSNKSYKYYEKKDYDNALDFSLKALQLDSENPTIHYNLASLYSLKGDEENTFFHIKRAVEEGYKNYDAFQKNSDFEFIRNCPKFNDFVNNGYKFEKDDAIVSDKYSELEKISVLKEKGILTEDEFISEKNKILSGKK
jgi:tetratricopeptide (TPR) repeat protein